MKRGSEVEVTLSDELLDHLYRLSFETDVPLRWLVAGLVYDTMESFGEEGPSRPRKRGRDRNGDAARGPKRGRS